MNIPIENFMQYGIAGLILFVLGAVLRWVFKTMDRIITNSQEERKNWQSLVKSWQDALTEHTASAKEFHKQVTEAHAFQKKEHESMLGMLNKI